MNKKSKTAEKPDELLSKKRGRRVKIAIGRTGKNQKDFALEVLHTSQQHLSCIVTGKHNLTRDNAERIATAADVRVEWLWCEDDFMTTEEIEETDSQDAGVYMTAPELETGRTQLMTCDSLDDLIKNREVLENAFNDMKQDKNFAKKKIRFVLELAFD